MIIRFRRGFTLVEMLTVIAIIGLLAALLFPVLTRARQQGNTADAIAKSRQVVAGLLLYKEDAGTWPARHVWEAVDSGHIDPAVMYVKGDPRPEGLAQWFDICMQFRSPLGPSDRNSFEDVFASDSGSQQGLLKLLSEKGEENPALVVYRGVGDWIFDSAPTCTMSFIGYQRRILRARLDGSVKIEPFSNIHNGQPYLCWASRFSSIDDRILCEDINR